MSSSSWSATRRISWIRGEGFPPPSLPPLLHSTRESWITALFVSPCYDSSGTHGCGNMCTVRLELSLPQLGTRTSRMQPDQTCQRRPSFLAHLLASGCRQVSIEEGDGKSRDLNVIFIETSAKAGFNIKVQSARSQIFTKYQCCVHTIFWDYSLLT